MKEADPLLYKWYAFENDLKIKAKDSQTYYKDAIIDLDPKEGPLSQILMEGANLFCNGTIKN